MFTPPSRPPNSTSPPSTTFHHRICHHRTFTSFSPFRLRQYIFPIPLQEDHIHSIVIPTPGGAPLLLSGGLLYPWFSSCIGSGWAGYLGMVDRTLLAFIFSILLILESEMGFKEGGEGEGIMYARQMLVRYSIRSKVYISAIRVLVSEEKGNNYITHKS